MKRTLVTVALVTALVVGAPTSVVAAEESGQDVHPSVAFALDAEPGGVATGYGSAEWPELGMTLEVSLVRAVGTCATGSICAYSEGGMAGTKLTWTTCGSKSTSALSTVGSIANARSSGTLSAREGTTVRASAAANTYANVPLAYRTAITNVYC
ncbi:MULTISPECIES: hypothetical protein [Microbacterium]|jgi:hypothetical protein|uniref:hypothetical protein n=1 Tax=Microbacterium TaxID=33882 RepID=UPI001BDE38C7|nr:MULTISPECIES: hypothetical protein [Microbacterium]MDY0910726.1 hypothetical protein [Microbacterium sp. CFBP9034]BFF12441.1 hypothetical protein GCM10025699_37440 [Microbacterium flavescens]